MKKDKEDLIIDELLEAYVKDVAEEDFKEFAHYFEEDEQYLTNKHLVENVKYEPTKLKKKPIRFTKYVAAAAAVLIIVSVTIPTEASAWRIWDLRFLFGEHEDHTSIKPEDKFPQYFVSDLIEGYEVLFESSDESNIMIQYQNKTTGEYILYIQVEKEQFVSQLDNENRNTAEEIIGDFKAVVSENENDIIFEAVTDRVAIYVQTDAGYVTGKAFIESLKEI